jgi:hypothetical protein
LAVDEGRAILAASDVTQGIRGARTVRLVEVRENENCLLTELVSSQGNLFNHLWASAAPFRLFSRRWGHDRLGIVGQSLGAWLRAYHGGTSVIGSDVTDAKSAIARQSRARIKSILTMAPGLLPESLAHALNERIATLQEAAVSTNTLLCDIHGDLNLSNVLVEKGTGDLVIIDFGNGRAGLGIEDVATVYCTALSIQSANRRSARALDRFLQELLNAYGNDASESNSLWRLMLVMCYLRLVLSYVVFHKNNRFTYLTGRAYRQIAHGSLHLLANDLCR